MGFPNWRRGHSIFPPSWKMKIIRRRKMQRIAMTWNHSIFTTLFHRIFNFHSFTNTALDMETYEGFSFCTNFSHYSAFQSPNILPFASLLNYQIFNFHLTKYCLFISSSNNIHAKCIKENPNSNDSNGPRKCLPNSTVEPENRRIIKGWNRNNIRKLRAYEQATSLLFIINDRTTKQTKIKNVVNECLYYCHLLYSFFSVAFIFLRLFHLFPSLSLASFFYILVNFLYFFFSLFAVLFDLNKIKAKHFFFLFQELINVCFFCVWYLGVIFIYFQFIFLLPLFCGELMNRQFVEFCV